MNNTSFNKKSIMVSNTDMDPGRKSILDIITCIYSFAECSKDMDNKKSA